MNKLITALKKMPLTVYLAWLFLLTLFVVFFVAEPMAAVAVGVAVGIVAALKRLFEYYALGD